MTAPDLAVDTRTAILDAAAILFARQGLDSTTIKDIGRAAGVNPALLYYYFADKAALYEAVLSRMMTRFPNLLTAVAETEVPPREAVAAVIRMQAEIFLAEPLLPRLIARELADHEARHAAPVIREHAQRLLGALTALIVRGQEAGVFRANLTPPLAAVSCLSQLNWYCIAGPAMDLILNRDNVARDPASVRQFAEHVVEFTLAGLEHQ
jgi:TetR/AcrR family transcriptional regulator